MAQLYANNAEGLLAAGISAGDTTITLQDATRFPALGAGEWHWATLTAAADVETAWEIVKVTARTGTTLTVTRAQQGTTAAAWQAGAKLELRATAADYERSWDKYLAHATDSLGSSTGSSFSVTPEEQNLSYESGQKVKVFHYRYVGPTAYLDQFTGQVLSYDGVTLTIYNATYSGDDGPYTNWTIDRWVDPDDFNLAPVASSNDYLDLDNLPTLGTAAEHAQEDFATAAQGAKADTAIQAEDLGSAAYVDTSVFQPSDATLTALAALTIAADTLTIGTGADAFSQITFAANTFPAKGSTGNLVAKTISDTGLSLVAGADAAAMRTTLGLGTLATQSGTFSGISSGTNTGDQTITLTGEVTGSGTGSFAATIDKSIAPTWTAAHTWSLPVAASSTDGLVLATSSTATSGNQKWSPRARFRASYFSGTAKTSDFALENAPTSSGGRFSISHSANGGSYSEVAAVTADGRFIVSGSGSSSSPLVHFSNHGAGNEAGFFYAPGSYSVMAVAQGVPVVRMGYGTLSVTRDASIGWSSSQFDAAPTADTTLYRAAAANIRQGGPAANPPVAQTLSVQDASGTDIAGATWTFRASRGTGIGAITGKFYIWQVPSLGVTGTTLQTAVEGASLTGDGILALPLKGLSGLVRPRVQTTASAATVTPNADTDDLVTITAQAVGLTIANPTTAASYRCEGQKLMIRIKDNGGAQTIAFGSEYRAMGTALPTTTVAGKTLYLGFIRNETDSKWDLVSSAQEA